MVDMTRKPDDLCKLIHYYTGKFESGFHQPQYMKLTDNYPISEICTQCSYNRPYWDVI